ncbi:MAG: fasciclin domain-containing protein [Chitinophagaceae bacterium]|nr:fasciclin domain-containing protein [Chitinophagaceae bacterium]
MKRIIYLAALGVSLLLLSCNNSTTTTEQTSVSDAAVPAGGQESVKDDESAKDVVKIAVGSKDHTTLVAALKQADLVTSLSNAGPFTVFAPTNAAFDKLPAGTVEGLMKSDKLADLQNILQYHVAVAVYKTENMKDGQVIGEANGDNITINVKDGKVMVNGTANIVASIPASNGIIHVIDAVLLPPGKK